MIRNLCLGFVLLLPTHLISVPASLSGVPSSLWLLDSYRPDRAFVWRNVDLGTLDLESSKNAVSGA